MASIARTKPLQPSVAHAVASAPPGLDADEAELQRLKTAFALHSFCGGGCCRIVF